MKTLTLFHTAQSNAVLFEDTAEALGDGCDRRHVVRADLLARAEAAGAFTSQLEAEAAEAMRALLQPSGVLLCTCSTIGSAADRLAREGRRVLRTDRALAEDALSAGGTVAVLYAVATTQLPTQMLFADVARAYPDATFDMHHVDDAWQHFQRGALTAYYEAIARVIRILEKDYATIALAQASMAPVAAMQPWTATVLASPASGLKAAEQLFRAS